MNAITPHDLNEAVRSTSMLSDVTISVWGGERADTDVTSKIRADNNATGDVGRFIKKLLAGVDGSLKDTKSAFNAVRMKHYALTLPWVSDPHALRNSGARLLPNLLFDRYMGEMGQAKRAAQAALDKFIAEYPDLVLQAKANLGGLADVVYPTADEVRGKFRVTFDFEPIPAGAEFRGLSDTIMGKLSAQLAAKQNRMIMAAQKCMWDEVRQRVGHLADRLVATDAEGKPAMFKATTVENVRDLLVLVPGWNICAEPNAADVTEDIRVMLDGVTPDNIRDHAPVRAEVAKRAAWIVSKLDQWGV